MTETTTDDEMDSVDDRRGWGLLPPKEVRERKEREWAEGIAKAEAIGEQVASLRERLPTEQQGA